MPEPTEYTGIEGNFLFPLGAEFPMGWPSGGMVESGNVGHLKAR